MAYPLPVKLSLMMALDAFFSVFTLWVAFSFRFQVWHVPSGYQWYAYVISLVLMWPFFVRLGLYRTVYRYSGSNTLVAVFKASLFYGCAFFLALFFLKMPWVPRSLGVIQPLLLLLFAGGSRLLIKHWLADDSGGALSEGQRLVVYGAGYDAVETASALESGKRYTVVAFIDQDGAMRGRVINGKKVYGPESLPHLVTQKEVDAILLAMPSITRQERNDIINRLQPLQVKILVAPGIDAIMDGRVSVSDIREVEIEDLLGRDPFPPDHELIARHIEGRAVLVTGAGGSIGSELCRQLALTDPSVLIIVDHAEYNLFSIHRELQHLFAGRGSETVLVPVLGDVTDEGRMFALGRRYRPAVIYHAAAYKHVPLLEVNPLEGLRNNVFGSLTVARMARAFHVPSVVLVSSDKAVRPTNLMGASKRVCELIFQAFAAELGAGSGYSIVRFGNVLGSSGSVVPLFREQIRNGGPVTVTHHDVVRYFMTIPEAAQLIIQSGAMGGDGEVFLLDMGEPVKIIDLARRMISLSRAGDVTVVVTGLRAGEKLQEELLIGADAIPTFNPRIFKAMEGFLDYPDLELELQGLSEAIRLGDEDAMMAILCRLVPEYRRERYEPVGPMAGCRSGSLK